MHILVTNDDDVLAPGLLALTQEMRKIGEVSIVAPERNWSGGGHVKTFDRPLRSKEVNLPEGEINRIRITRQGMRVYRDRLDQRIDPRGRPYYWISGDAPTGLAEEGTDIGALSEGYVSITPLQLDLTAFPAMHLLNAWTWKEITEPSFA